MNNLIDAELINAIRANDIKAVRAALDAGASVTQTDAQGRSPLHIAAAHRGGSRVVRLLLSFNADANRDDRSCMTALHVAVENRNYSSANHLLQCGADKDFQRGVKVTPLFTAIYCDIRDGTTDRTRFLLNAGVDLSKQVQRNGAMFTALETAIDMAQTIPDARAVADEIQFYIANGRISKIVETVEDQESNPDEGTSEMAPPATLPEAVDVNARDVQHALQLKTDIGRRFRMKI